MRPRAEAALPDAHFWNGKRVLLTGHSGFKGAWLSYWLAKMGAKVSGISLPPERQPNLSQLLGDGHLAESSYVDIRDAAALRKQIAAFRPDIVLHLAAQALVRRSYADPLNTFTTNVVGTANVLEAVRGVASVRVVVVVTSDKVYRNLEQMAGYRETDTLGGHDPYSSSKACAELVAASYRDSFLAQQGVLLATARAGNVIGGGDWSEDRLIPDAIRAWTENKPLSIRRPDAVRPWQHVLEPLCGYLVLAERVWTTPELTGAYNFSPGAAATVSVRKAIEYAQQHWPGAHVAFGDDTSGPHEAGLLVLDAAKAETALGVRPRWSLETAIGRAVGWYAGLARGASARELCDEDLAAYLAPARQVA